MQQIEETPIKVIVTTEDAAPDVELHDYQGYVVPLSSLWAATPTVLVFLRHFGCPHCRAQAIDLRREKRKFDALGAQVVLVGLGVPEKAAEFRTELDLRFQVLSDPQKVGYAAYDLLRVNPFREINLTSASRFAHDTLRYGVRLAPAGQDFMQLGGYFVIDRAGTVRLAYRGERASDHPEMGELLAALQA